MSWNWQRKDWPEFRYDSTGLVELENRFLRESGTLLGAFKHLNSDERQSITIQWISDEALKTSEIEGEILDRESLQSSIRRQLGFQADDKKASLKEKGIAEMMVDLYQNFEVPLSHKTLFQWHWMLLAGSPRIKERGCYRTSADAMQIVSGPIHDPKVHFEAPHSRLVSGEMERFVQWYLNSKSTLPALTRAGIAHSYFVSVHPFEDGNGRIARAISEKSMAGSIGQPSLVALAQTIEKKRKDYYEALRSINKTNDITTWLHYFAATVLESQKATLDQIEFSIKKAKFYDRFGQRLNDRQAKVIVRIFKEGPGGFK
ncbi:MAG: DUF4172 domain-containing protein, partial [Verrucomicrobia bacterium]|nr:DUF4172 domain-containing protein [Verrucomicrobiota bacterium]